MQERFVQVMIHLYSYHACYMRKVLAATVFRKIQLQPCTQDNFVQAMIHLYSYHACYMRKVLAATVLRKIPLQISTRKKFVQSNDPSLLLSREKIPGRKEDSTSSQYAREICASNDFAVYLSCLLHEESPGYNSSKEDSASTQYAIDICPSNGPYLLLSGLLQEEIYGCNSSKEDSASNQYKKETRLSSDPSLLLSRLLNAETPDCSSSEKWSKSELYSHFRNLSVNNCSRTQLIGSSSTQCESSVSEQWNEKFAKGTKERRSIIVPERERTMVSERLPFFEIFCAERFKNVC
ncbi:hypothetical protein O6H91_09G053600 [Diphasiastrum complanatum]|uniref:Uncharacterized protein n=1 Tax=Diphasiastrum complanatum TaxID=34168 RepID=A0ACC2CP80_DIPCM|nr:hypothetical protein O6H91_09G053600 [Diphasiastrum complanatum]